MAYQPKSLRKFMAASISTAVVASAVAPVVANAEAAFTDVETSDWFYDSINYLTDKGVIDGFEDGSFRPSEDVTRAQAAKILAVTLGLDTENVEAIDFPDVEEGDWFYNYVAALTATNVIEGFEDGTFRPDETLTRAQMAKMIAVAYGIEAEGEVELPFNDLKGATWAEEHIAALFGAGIVEGVAEGEYAPLANVTRAQVAAFVYKTEKADDNEEPAAPEELAIEGVEAANLIQVEVTFNQENFDEDEVNDIDNYELEDADGDELDIKDIDIEGNKAILTLEEAAKNNSDATLTVDANVTGEKAEFDLKFIDNEIPELTDVAVVGKNTVKVKFSEPMDFGEVGEDKLADEKYEDSFEIKMGKKTYSVKEIEVLKNGTEANVKVNGSFTEGELELDINSGLEDFAGFDLVPTTKTIEVVVDTEAPEVVDFKDAEPNKVTLVFNEDIELDGAKNEDFYHTNTKNMVNKFEVEGNELTLYFDDNEMPDGTAYVYIEKDVIVDLWDNKVEDKIRTAVEVTRDEEAPEVDEIEATENEVVVTFSETVDEDSAEDEDNYTILDADGDEIEDAIRVAKSQGAEVTLKFSDDLDNGTYTLVIDGVEDTEGNAIENHSEEFTIDDEEDPSVAEVLVNSNAAGDEHTLIVRYSEEMDVDGKYSILDLATYDLVSKDQDGKVVNRMNLEDIADEKDVDVDIDAIENNEAVEITIEGKNIDGYGFLSVARAADTAGNYTAVGSEALIKDAKTTNFDIQDVVATAKDELEVQFETYVDEIKASDFAVLNADDEVIATISSVEEIDSDEVIFELSDEIPADTTGLKLEVTAENPSTNSVFGTTIKADASKDITDDIAPSVVEDDNEVQEVKVDATNKKVEITFDEDVQYVTNGTFEINGGNVDIKEITVAGNVVTITVADDETVEIGDDIEQLAAIADKQGNKTDKLKLEVEK
ncbi:S-layer homology domain-containing protein [Bacillus solimangrovi]|uniref:SLH domain-containing protein n=1 Tax=Bacillus solimangrovi TaxID=1305675 RepID=A0A1E5LFK6_9BACI|nr:S-layer homology domain-containing protein [Bacillus solimangrovi]OEH92852.1 hypothetical protein BFG57_02335 [Bacillus solimangrovi]